ncbi:MAG: hypothetical protein QXG03_06330 [Halalkalicoccus sp.]
MIAPATGLPPDTLVALALVVSGPILAAMLHLIDRRRGDGEISIAGRR